MACMCPVIKPWIHHDMEGQVPSKGFPINQVSWNEGMWTAGMFLFALADIPMESAPQKCRCYQSGYYGDTNRKMMWSKKLYTSQSGSSHGDDRHYAQLCMENGLIKFISENGSWLASIRHLLIPDVTQGWFIPEAHSPCYGGPPPCRVQQHPGHILQ